VLRFAAAVASSVAIDPALINAALRPSFFFEVAEKIFFGTPSTPNIFGI
jgi:hypothetical protein